MRGATRAREVGRRGSRKRDFMMVVEEETIWSGGGRWWLMR